MDALLRKLVNAFRMQLLFITCWQGYEFHSKVKLVLLSKA